MLTKAGYLLQKKKRDKNNCNATERFGQIAGKTLGKTKWNRAKNEVIRKLTKQNPITTKINKQ